ncbi:MAG TPA: haloacid dehalogenase type II [Solirubrobacterales bacterium]|nr:haloacid dehalogenase type II [Solirubrobacterales bacterium]
MIESVRALTFDVFGTVVDWRSSLIREGEALARRKGLAGVDWEAFADRWRALYQPALTKVRINQIPWTKLDDLHRMSLDSLLDEFGIKGLGEPEIDDLNRAWHRLDPWPDAVPGLTRLRKKYVLATLSNGNVALIVNMAKRAGLPWDAVLGAEVARRYKPEPRCYLTTASMLGLKPAQCMMVAAHNGDLGAASALGFRTAFVVRPTEHGPKQTTDLRAEREWDVVAQSFEDLAGKLGC